jgi:hypothetical protein
VGRSEPATTAVRGLSSWEMPDCAAFWWSVGGVVAPSRGTLEETWTVEPSRWASWRSRAVRAAEGRSKVINAFCFFSTQSHVNTGQGEHAIKSGLVRALGGAMSMYGGRRWNYRHRVQGSSRGSCRRRRRSRRLVVALLRRSARTGMKVKDTLVAEIGGSNSRHNGLL